MIRLSLLLLIALTGCATDPATLSAVLDAHAKARPTLSVTCPAGGCSVEYTDPRDRKITMPTNGWDAAVSVSNNLTGLVSGAVPYAVVGAVAVQAVKHAGHNTQTTNTASGAGSSTAGPGSYAQIGPDSANTTSGDTITDSHDSQTADSHDISGSYNPVDSHDQTATPVVVDPVVVNPVVVQVPAAAVP